MSHFNKIRQRTEPNDEWITPEGVVDIQLSMIKPKKDEIWFDPFKNDGAYYKKFPCDDDKKDFTEMIKRLILSVLILLIHYLKEYILRS